MATSMPEYNVFATNISEIEKVYCNTHNHDVKAHIVYSNVDSALFVDKELTLPVSYKLIEELYYSGVVIVRDIGDFYDGEYKPFSLGYGDMGPCLLCGMMNGYNLQLMGFGCYDYAETSNPS